MVIDNVSAVFNGTRVECFYGHQVMTTTIIKVIGNGMFINEEFCHECFNNEKLVQERIGHEAIYTIYSLIIIPMNL